MQEIDVLYIFDKDDNFINTVSNISEYVYKKQTNGIGELKISSPVNSDLIKYNKVGFWNEDEFCLFEIDAVDSDIYADEEICEVIALEDVITLRDNMIEERRMRDATIRQGLEKALEGTRYGIGHIDDNKELRTYNYYFKNSLECLNIVLKEYVMEFVARVELKENNKLEKFIDVYFRVGRDTGLRFTYDINLQLLERSESNSPHFNVLYGFGKSLETENGGFSRKLTFDSVNNGKKYIEDTESIAKYGRRVGKFEDGKIEDVNDLLQATKAKLKEVKDLQYTYKATVKEVSDFLNFEHFDISNGDYAIIADEERDSVFKARVAEVTYIKDSRGVLNKSFVFGALSRGLFDDSLEDKFNDLNDRLDYIQNQKPEIPPIDEQYPNDLPPRSNVTVTGLYSSIAIEWTFENKSYFWYELYASKQNNFVPQSTDLIFKGQASAYLHQVSPGETWYYRVRAINSYGNTNMFSEQVVGHSFKVSDATVFFEDMAIKHALIESLDMDKATVGKLKGTYIDAKELSVTDGNENQTLYIDSYGNISANIKELKIKGENVISETGTINKINEGIKEYKKDVDNAFKNVNDAYVALESEMNGSFKDGILTDTEKQNLKNQLTNLEVEKDVLIKEIDELIENKYLQNTNQLVALVDAKRDFIYRFYTLINAIRGEIGEPPLEVPNIPGLTIERDLTMHFPHFSNKFNPAYPDISLIEDYEGSVYLFDGGEKTNQYEVENYLKSRNINKVDKIFITHSHSDHIEGIPYLIDKFGCKELYLRTPQWDALDHWETVWKTRELHEAMVAKATEVGARIIEITDDITIPLNDRSNIKVFNSKNTAWGNYNNVSLGYLFNFTSKNGTIKKLFIQGDMSYQAEDFVGGQNVGKVDLLKLGHHGNVSSNGETWLSHLRPTYSIATLGYPQGNQVKLNAMRCKFVSSKVYLPNDNPNFMSVTISKDDGNISTTAVEHNFYCEWYQRDNGDWYYFKANGDWAINENLIINGLRYYFDNNGLCTNPGGETVG
ncbi:MAG: phage tail protein [Streptococcus agalactiae]|nr:phage tail protein [Streptococcus agalactiae]